MNRGMNHQREKSFNSIHPYSLSSFFTFYAHSHITKSLQRVLTFLRCVPIPISSISVPLVTCPPLLTNFAIDSSALLALFPT